MAEVVPLTVLFGVEEDDDGGDEVDHLTRGQKVQVAASVSTSVAVDPIEAGFDGRRRTDLIEAVRVEEGRGGKQLDGPAADIHPHKAVLIVESGILGAEIKKIRILNQTARKVLRLFSLSDRVSKRVLLLRNLNPIVCLRDLFSQNERLRKRLIIQNLKHARRRPFITSPFFELSDREK